LEKHKIKPIIDSLIFLEICEKLKYIKDCRLKEDRLYNLMIAGLYDNKIYSYASFDRNKINGCSVLYVNEDINGELSLFVILLWIDPHYPLLWKKYKDFVEKKAKEFKVRKISFTTNREEKAVIRKLGKYGYKKSNVIFEKEVV